MAVEQKVIEDLKIELLLRAVERHSVSGAIAYALMVISEKEQFHHIAMPMDLNSAMHNIASEVRELRNSQQSIVKVLYDIRTHLENLNRPVPAVPVISPVG